MAYFPIAFKISWTNSISEGAPTRVCFSLMTVWGTPWTLYLLTRWGNSEPSIMSAVI